MYRILVAVDEDGDRAAALAEAVLSLADAVDELEALVVHVFRNVDVPPQVSIHQPTEDYEELLDDLWEAPSTIQEVADRLRDAGVETQVRLEEGDPAETVVELAAEGDVDNVYVSGRKRSPTGKALFGSTTQAIILNAGVPVTVVGSSEK